MRLRNLALSGGAALGAAAALNATAAHESGRPLPNPVGGEEGWFEWRGHRVAWTRHGQGPAMLLVHAIHAAAWNFEWRRAVDRLAAEHTVWTIDLLGFGRSDRPRLKYTSALYVQLVRDFLEQQIAEPTVLVGSSLSGAYTVALAAREGTRGAPRIPALVLVCPTGVTHLASTPGPINDVARRFVNSPGVGATMFNALVTKPSMRMFLSQTYATDGWVTPELLDAYYATAHQPGARHAVSAFVGMQLNLNVRDALKRLEMPLLITWGEQAKEVPLTELAAYRSIRPDAEVAMFSPCGSLPHDERAEEWCATVLDFAARATEGAVDRAAQLATGTDGRFADRPVERMAVAGDAAQGRRIAPAASSPDERPPLAASA